MNLRQLVPALGFIAFTAGTASAADGVTIGGFVDTIASFENTSDDGQRGDPQFSAATEIRIGYKIGDRVGAQIDVEWNNESANDVDLEQAYINYALTDTTSFTMGKFTSFLGWVSADADGLYRVNSGIIPGALYGTDLVGGAVSFSPSEQLGVSLFVVNGFGAADTSPNLNQNTNDYFGLGADVTFDVDGLGAFNGEVAYDAASSDDAETFHVGFNATIKLPAYEPLTLGAEVIFQSTGETVATNDGVDRLGLLAMANHIIPGAPFPMSATLMLQHLSISNDAPNTDSTNTEVAVALLTNPTGDSHFGANAELFFRTLDDDTLADNRDTFGLALELIAVIP